MRLLDLPDHLRKRGLTVREYPGWRERGWHSNLSWATPEMKAGEMVRVEGFVVHDTGTSLDQASAENQLAYMFVNASIAPIPQLALMPDGTVVMGASGYANHAGASTVPWPSSWPDGRTISPIAIGCEIIRPHGDLATAVWPKAQIDAAITLAAAVCDRYGLDAGRVVGHLEVARPWGRKVDPRGPWEQGGSWWQEGLPAEQRRLDRFRGWVQAVLDIWHAPPPPPLPPATWDGLLYRVPDPLEPPSWWEVWRRTHSSLPTEARVLTLIAANPGVTLAPGVYLKIPGMVA